MNNVAVLISLLVVLFSTCVIGGPIAKRSTSRHHSHDAFLPDIVEHFESLSNVLAQSENHDEVYTSLDTRFGIVEEGANGQRNCPDTDDLEVLCPTFEYHDHDHNRRPSTIIHSMCQCTGCPSGTCQPYKRPLRVLRRESKSDDFVRAWEFVSLACYCRNG